MSKKKTNQTSNQTQSQQTSSNSSQTNTTRPDVPEWLLNPAQTMAGNLGKLVSQGASTYAPQISGLQQQVFSDAASLKPNAQLADAASRAAGLKTNTGLLDAQSRANSFGVNDLLTQAGASAKNLGVSDLLKQAGAAASGLSLSPYFDQAGSLLNGIGDAAGSSALDYIKSYENPYKDSVLNPVLADYDVQSGKTRAAQAAQAAQGAFRGSRYGIREGETEGELARGRASTEGGLLNQMYAQALGAAQQEAAQRQALNIANQQAQFQKAGLLQGLGQATGAESRANIGLQSQIGGQLTDQERANIALQGQLGGQLTDQERANIALQGQLGQQVGSEERSNVALSGQLGQQAGADQRATLGMQGDIGAQQTELENQIRQYPLEFQRQQEALLAGLNPALFTGQTSTGQQTSQSQGTGTSTGNSTTTEDPGLLSNLGTAASIASVFLSDRRLKRDIRPAWVDWAGRQWVEFAYRWAPKVRHIGLIAQDVLKTDPEAVRLEPSGYLSVNYGALI